VSEEEGMLGGCVGWKDVEASGFCGRDLVLWSWLGGFGRRSGLGTMARWDCGHGSVSEERRGVWPAGRTNGVSWNLGEDLLKRRLSLWVCMHTGSGGLDAGEVSILSTNSGVILCDR